MNEERFFNAHCTLTRAVDKVGGKWKPVIINVMGTKTVRFGQLAAVIPYITRKVLAEQLKQLQEDGIILRTSFNDRLPRVEYKLTEGGLAFLPVLNSMKEWSAKFDKGANRNCKKKAKASTKD